MCSWQQETASLAGGLFSNPSLGSSSGHPAAAKKARQGAEDDIKLSHADLHVSNHRQPTCSLPRTDARHAVAKAGLNTRKGQAGAEVAKASRKRAADSSCAEPATKRLLRGKSSNMQLTGATVAASSHDSHRQGSTAVAGAVSYSLVVDAAAAAVPTSSGGSDSRAAQHGSGAGAAEMAEGMASGRRRVVKREGRALKMVNDDLGDEGVQAMEAC